MVTPCPFLRLRGVDGDREDAGKAVQKNTGGRSHSRRSGKEGKDRGRECRCPQHHPKL